MKRLVTALLLAATSAAPAQIAPPDRARPQLEIATSAALAPVLRAIARAYERDHAGARISVTAPGSDVAMADLYTGRADIAILGREATDPEAKAFEWIWHHPVSRYPLWRGSIATVEHSPAVAILVALASPLRAITLAGLAARLRVGGADPVVMSDSESGTGRFLRHTILADANQLDWARVVEMPEGRIASRVAGDPAAIGIGGSVAPGVRILPVTIDGAPLAPGDAGYPFDRTVVAYADAGGRADARAFLTFATSDAARAIVAASPYRPATH